MSLNLNYNKEPDTQRSGENMQEGSTISAKALSKNEVVTAGDYKGQYACGREWAEERRGDAGEAGW